ncbi:hypothetical protein ABT282_07430 [Streptomyces sp. NPDC000927]|uniref:hypothetical protein n=1 Tax=Streptomyces sp. NPDC000927 TaxID=3154371 RepID=UPI003321D432
MADDDFNYGECQVRKLGNLNNGGKAKLWTKTGETHHMNLSPDKLRRIAAIVAEPEND